MKTLGDLLTPDELDQAVVALKPGEGLLVVADQVYKRLKSGAWQVLQPARKTKRTKRGRR